MPGPASTQLTQWTSLSRRHCPWALPPASFVLLLLGDTAAPSSLPGPPSYDLPSGVAAKLPGQNSLIPVSCHSWMGCSLRTGGNGRCTSAASLGPGREDTKAKVRWVHFGNPLQVPSSAFCKSIFPACPLPPSSSCLALSAHGRGLMEPWKSRHPLLQKCQGCISGSHGRGLGVHRIGIAFIGACEHILVNYSHGRQVFSA